MAKIQITNQAEPDTPPSGTSEIYVDSTSKELSSKDDAGVVRSAAGYTHPNHSGDVTSVSDGAMTLQSVAITGQSSATVATADTMLISDTDDSGNLKEVTVQSVADLAAGDVPAWTTFTPNILGGGTLTFTTSDARFYVTGKLIYVYLTWTQTAAGSGSATLTIDVPGSVTVLDQGNVGTMSAFDMGNNNIHNQFGVLADNATNTFQMYRTDSSTLILGGANIGNNGFSRNMMMIAPLA